MGVQFQSSPRGHVPLRKLLCLEARGLGVGEDATTVVQKVGCLTGQRPRGLCVSLYSTRTTLRKCAATAEGGWRPVR